MTKPKNPRMASYDRRNAEAGIVTIRLRIAAADRDYFRTMASGSRIEAKAAKRKTRGSGGAVEGE